MFIFWSINLSFANSSQTLLLQCPLIVNDVKEKIPNLKYLFNPGMIGEMRFFKLKINEFDAHLTINSAMIMSDNFPPLEQFFSDTLSEEETDIQNNIFKWNFTDAIVVDNGFLKIDNSEITAEGIIWYRKGNDTLLKYSHHSWCTRVSKKTLLYV